MMKEIMIWDGNECEIDNNTVGFRYTLNDDDFPRIFEDKECGLVLGVNVTSFDEDSEMDSMIVYVKWDDLISDFIERDDIYYSAENVKRRALVIATLERTIEKLKKLPRPSK